MPFALPCHGTAQPHYLLSLVQRSTFELLPSLLFIFLHVYQTFRNVLEHQQFANPIMTSWAQPSPEAFVYRPLDASKQEIRLLRLVINHRGKVEALIEHVHIETAPPYRALSYTWGSEDVTNVICLNGCTFEIRQNLFEFFDVYMCRYAQKAEEIDRETHWLWVDQVSCIGARIPNGQLGRLLAITRTCETGNNASHNFVLILWPFSL